MNGTSLLMDEIEKLVTYYSSSLIDRFEYTTKTSIVSTKVYLKTILNTAKENIISIMNGIPPFSYDCVLIF